MKVIIYDDRNMSFYEVFPSAIEHDLSNYYDIEEDVRSRVRTVHNGCMDIVLTVDSMPKPCILDDTTMKKIAKYNLMEENKILVKEKELAELKLQQIKDKIDRFNAKYKEIIKFIDNDFRSDDEDNDSYDDYDD